MGDSWIHCMNRLLLFVYRVLPNCLYCCQFRDMKPAVLPVKTCWQVANLPSLSLLCHLSPQTSEAPKVNFTWNFIPPCACVEYNVFSSMFWASLSVCRHMVQLVCMCVCVYFHPTPSSPLSLPSECVCVARPPLYLCHYSTQECVFHFVAMPTWHCCREKYVCAF